MLGLEGLLEEYKIILRDFYPETCDYWELEDDNLLGFPAKEAREQAKRRLNELKDKVDALWTTDELGLYQLLLHGISEKLTEIDLKTEIKIKEAYYWSIFPSVGGSLFSVMDKLNDSIEAKPEKAVLIAEKFLRYLHSIPTFVEETLSSGPFVRGWTRYDRGNVKCVLGEGEGSIDYIFNRLQEIDGITKERLKVYKQSIREAKKKLREYRDNVLKQSTIKEWPIGKNQLEKLYSTFGYDGTIDQMVIEAKESFSEIMDKIDLLLKSKFENISLDDAMKSIVNNKIIDPNDKKYLHNKDLFDEDLRQSYITKARKILDKLESAGLRLPKNVCFEFKLLPKPARKNSPGIFSLVKNEKIDGKIVGDIWINPDDETINFIDGLTNTILHEVFGHVLHQYYDDKLIQKSKYFSLFFGTKETSEGVACYLERFDGLIKLTKQEKLYGLFESLKPYIRLLEEIAILTSDISVLEGIAGFKLPKRHSYMKDSSYTYYAAAKLNSKFRLLPYRDAKYDMESYVKFPENIGASFGYGSSYGRGLIMLNKMIKGNNLRGIKKVLEYGTLPLGYIASRL